MFAIAFHPDFASQVTRDGHGRLYVTWMSPSRVLTLGVFVSSPETGRAEIPPRIIIEIPRASFDHNGGDLEFGPDGYLYLSVGDGSLAGKQGLEAQSLNSRLGKILRIDVDRTTEDKRTRYRRTTPS